jgi:hypothetical protein
MLRGAHRQACCVHRAVVNRVPAHRIRWAAALALFTTATAAAPSTAAAQPVTAGRVDVGSFSILREGARVGREQFSIRRVGSPDGVEFELRSEATIDERRVATRLDADSAGTPIRYTVEERDPTGVVLRLGGQQVRGRFAALTRSRRGEAAREYLLPPETVILETTTFHQAAVLLLSRGERTDRRLLALAPLDNHERDVRLILDAPSDPVLVAGVRIEALRWLVEDPVGRRILWTDADGRLLRITIPSLGLEAVRDAVP